MKSNITALVLVCLTSFAALANAPASFSIVSATASVYSVQYKSAETGKVKVSIYNSAKQLVFSEVLSNVASFVRPYNFSNLSEGEYTIVLEDKNGKQAEKINYAMNKITSVIKVSEVADASDKFLLNVTTTGTEVVTVRIFDSLNNMVYHKEVEVTGNLGIVYNLGQVKLKDKVTFEVSTSNGKVETIVF